MEHYEIALGQAFSRGNGVSPTAGTIEEILERLHERYRANGWSEDLWVNDRSLLRRIGVHPQDATVRDLERVLMRARSQGTKASYAARLRSLYKNMRALGLVTAAPDLELPDIRKGRTVPRPLTLDERRRLLYESKWPERDWFTLGLLAGFRAIEVSRAEGHHLSRVDEYHCELLILGKGGTELTVPVLPEVARIYEEAGTLGRLWPVVPRTISENAGREMRRLGIGGKAHFHRCRHTFATTLLESSGWDLLTTQRLMRHSNVNTTTNYTKLRHDRPREVLSSLADLDRAV